MDAQKLKKLKNVINIESETHLKDSCEKNEILVVFITAKWNESHSLTALIAKVAASTPDIPFAHLQHSDLFRVTEDYSVKALPAIIVIQTTEKSICLAKLENPKNKDANEFLTEWTSKISARKMSQREVKIVTGLDHESEGKSKKSADLCRKTEDEEIKSFLRSEPVILLVEDEDYKGVDGILSDNGVVFEEFNVNADAEIKKAIAGFSGSDDFPQLYILGKYFGGKSLISKKAKTGELKKTIPKHSTTESLNLRLKNLINREEIMLFMKGSPQEPKCGFSLKMVNLLKSQEGFDQFGHFDILSDNTVREGLKKYSNWATYPQLYIKGELMGGLDVVKGLAESGELKSCLGDE